MQLAAAGLAELVRVIEGLESREAARDALESRPALEIEFAFNVGKTRVCLRLDASTTTAHNLLGVSTHYSRMPQYVETSTRRLGEVTFEYDGHESNDACTWGYAQPMRAGGDFHDRYAFVPRLNDGAMCAPKRGDVYVIPQDRTRGKYRVCMRTDDGACFDAYKIGTVTEGIDALDLEIGTVTDGIAVRPPYWPYPPARFSTRKEAIGWIGAPLYGLIQRALDTCRTVTADELYAIYCATPVQGAMTHAQFCRALILCSPAADGPVALFVSGYTKFVSGYEQKRTHKRWDSIDCPTSPGHEMR